MAQCRSFETIGRNYVDFDIENKHHLEAAKLLCEFDTDIPVRQHPEIRFYLEAPYDNIRIMVMAKMVDKFLETQGI